jgi:hypothetical protein
MKFSGVRDPIRLNRKIRGRDEKHRHRGFMLTVKASTGGAVLDGISRKLRNPQSG